MNTIGISSNDKSVTVAAAVTTDVQSALHQHAHRLTEEYATDSLPHRRCDPSRTTPLSAAPSSGWQCWRWQFSTIFFIKKSNISAMDRLVAVKFHINIANRWLFMTLP